NRAPKYYLTGAGVRGLVERVKLRMARLLLLPQRHSIGTVDGGSGEEEGRTKSYRRRGRPSDVTRHSTEVRARSASGDAPEDGPEDASDRRDAPLPIGVSTVLEASSSARADTVLQRGLMDCAMGVVKAREAERGARVVVEGLEGRWTELSAGCSAMELSRCVAPPPVGDLCGILSLGGKDVALCKVEQSDATEGRCWVVVLGERGQRVWVEPSDLCLLPGAIKAAARALLRDMDEASAELRERMAGTKEAVDRASSAQEGLIAALEEE
ncbi:hypothetical protein FOZ62_013798, partial [Perkinsus olseni]